MISLRPCLHCRHRADCPIREDILARVRSVGLSSKLGAVTFRCPERWQGLEIGREASVVLVRYGGDGEAHLLPPIRGVVVKHNRDGRVTLWLDERTTQGKVRIRLNPDYPGLTPLATMREVCAECGRPKGVAMRDDEPKWFCDSCGTMYDVPPQSDDFAEAN